MINIIAGFLFLVGAAALLTWFMGMEVTIPFFNRLYERFPDTFTGDAAGTAQFIEMMAGHYLILFVVVGGLIWVIYESLWRKRNAV